MKDYKVFLDWVLENISVEQAEDEDFTIDISMDVFHSYPEVYNTELDKDLKEFINHCVWMISSYLNRTYEDCGHAEVTLNPLLTELTFSYTKFMGVRKCSWVSRSVSDMLKEARKALEYHEDAEYRSAYALQGVTGWFGDVIYREYVKPCKMSPELDATDEVFSRLQAVLDTHGITKDQLDLGNYAGCTKREVEAVVNNYIARLDAKGGEQ